jgi:hypothetical protein
MFEYGFQLLVTIERERTLIQIGMNCCVLESDHLNERFFWKTPLLRSKYGSLQLGEYLKLRILERLRIPEV